MGEELPNSLGSCTWIRLTYKQGQETGGARVGWANMAGGALQSL